MSNRVVANRVRDELNLINPGNDAIVVLKGIPISMVDSDVEKIDLAALVSNKLEYFMSIYGKRKILTYEEFILMADFIVSQYKKVYIFNNNIYMEQYPIEECFDDVIRAGLLNHFAESETDENDDSFIGDIDEYVSIFAGLKEHHGNLLGAYNYVPALQNTKIINRNLFDFKKEKVTCVNSEKDKFVDLVEEADYIDFVKLLSAEPDKICVRISNYTGDVNKLRDRIALISYFWKDYTNISFWQIQKSDEQYKHRDEYLDILKKYWGYTSYRNLSIYDMVKLEQGEKEIVQVSQEAIIANLVEEVEHCGDDGDFRDVFVTAPTGAGKSVMFQVPAVYLAEKYNLLTIVISPLIGLMNDQIKKLELKNYPFAKTINSDISPIIKMDIIEKIGKGRYHILYISPETLLSRSEVEQLIGNRTIGMIVIDEAHIVTTWGKQFRPDYWYLGDHIRKLRKKQMETKERSFVIATFTATAIYGGIEDMYTETINSLHMLNPITYLGYVKRDDIDIVIKKEQKAKGTRTEYELDKFKRIEEILRRAIITNKKTLVYFPTVAVIERCYEYLHNKHEIQSVAIYHGSLSKELPV